MMKSVLALSFAAALVAASPITILRRNEVVVPSSSNPIVKRKTGPIAKEFSLGGCRDNIFIFSRGSVEKGNMGAIAGPPTSDGLKAALGDDAVATEGVDYAALISTNFLDGGADLIGIDTMTDLVNKAAQDCPDSKLLVGGYSQGAAMVHRVVESLDPAVQDQIAGVVTFGDSQNEQDDGQINGFSPDKTKVICNDGDAVCDGTLKILPPHLDYTRRADEAVDFLVGQVNGAGAAGADAGAGADATDDEDDAAADSGDAEDEKSSGGGLLGGLFGGADATGDKDDDAAADSGDAEDEKSSGGGLLGGLFGSGD